MRAWPLTYGVHANDIDQEALESATKIANQYEFVVNDLPQGDATTVGECSMRLSGRQRQQIGIARAIYHNLQVLIWDQAISTLDNLTEQAVLEAANNLGYDITIFLIAHHLYTVRQCNKMNLLERRDVKANRSFKEPRAHHQRFVAMAV